MKQREKEKKDMLITSLIATLHIYRRTGSVLCDLAQELMSSILPLKAEISARGGLKLLLLLLPLLLLSECIAGLHWPPGRGGLLRTRRWNW